MVGPDAAADLAQAILALKGNPERRSAMGCKGLDYVRREISRPMIIARYCEAISQLVPDLPKNA